VRRQEELIEKRVGVDEDIGRLGRVVGRQALGDVAQDLGDLLDLVEGEGVLEVLAQGFDELRQLGEGAGLGQDLIGVVGERLLARLAGLALDGLDVLLVRDVAEQVLDQDRDDVRHEVVQIARLERAGEVLQEVVHGVAEHMELEALGEHDLERLDDIAQESHAQLRQHAAQGLASHLTHAL
jgi:hypothetical protein